MANFWLNHAKPRYSGRGFAFFGVSAINKADFNFHLTVTNCQRSCPIRALLGNYDHLFLLALRIPVSSHFLCAPFTNLEDDHAVRAGKGLFVLQFYLNQNILQDPFALAKLEHAILNAPSVLLQKSRETRARPVVFEIIGYDKHRVRH